MDPRRAWTTCVSVQAAYPAAAQGRIHFRIARIEEARDHAIDASILELEALTVRYQQERREHPERFCKDGRRRGAKALVIPSALAMKLAKPRKTTSRVRKPKPISLEPQPLSPRWRRGNRMPFLLGPPGLRKACDTLPAHLYHQS
jgi:hypothetical protein